MSVLMNSLPKLLLALPLIAVSSSCVLTKDARMAAENVLDPRTVQEFPWGRVQCGEGQVCSEVHVARVDVHGDPVEITLQNQTLESVAVQVMLETFNERGERTDRTGFHDVALAPRQESVLTLWQDLDEGEKLVVTLRARG
jgi:hypothetical protein